MVETTGSEPSTPGAYLISLVHACIALLTSNLFESMLPSSIDSEKEFCEKGFKYSPNTPLTKGVSLAWAKCSVFHLITSVKISSFVVTDIQSMILSSSSLMEISTLDNDDLTCPLAYLRSFGHILFKYSVLRISFTLFVGSLCP